MIFYCSDGKFPIRLRPAAEHQDIEITHESCNHVCAPANLRDSDVSASNPLDRRWLHQFIGRMDVRNLGLPGLRLLRPRRFSDARGHFSETYNERTFSAAGIAVKFVQDNESYSAKRGTVRGLHFQLPPAAQAKLVRVLQGSVYDVAVDLRIGSPTYGRWEGVTLTAHDGEQLFVPRGFAHAFCTLEPDTVVAYKVDDFYAPASDSGLIWNDPTLAIDWPVRTGEAVSVGQGPEARRFCRAQVTIQVRRRLMSKRILVTGGAGFIGSAVVRHIIRETEHQVLVVDKLTYAGNLDSLAPVSNDPRYAFVRADIADAPKMREVFESFQPDAVMHLAAESHVDRSIDGPGEFIQTNVVGTFTLLQAALGYWRALPAAKQDAFRFHHISTDEVFGSLGDEGLFCETTAYDPRSPYSASKAGVRSSGARLAPHLRPAGRRHQLLEQLRPVSFSREADPAGHHQRARGKLPVYGKGANVRDWLYVEDHARALFAVIGAGTPGHTYCVGGRSERANIDVVKTICALMDELAPNAKIGPRESLITFVADRPGARPALRHRRRQDRRTRLAAARDLRVRPAQDGRVVSRQPQLVGAHPLRRLSRRAAGSGRVILVFGNGQLGQELARMARRRAAR